MHYPTLYSKGSYNPGLRKTHLSSRTQIIIAQDNNRVLETWTAILKNNTLLLKRDRRRADLKGAVVQEQLLGAKSELTLRAGIIQPHTMMRGAEFLASCWVFHAVCAASRQTLHVRHRKGATWEYAACSAVSVFRQRGKRPIASQRAKSSRAASFPIHVLGHAAEPCKHRGI